MPLCPVCPGTFAERGLAGPLGGVTGYTGDGDLADELKALIAEEAQRLAGLVVMLVQCLVTILGNTRVQARLVLYCRGTTGPLRNCAGPVWVPRSSLPGVSLKLTGAFGDSIAPLGCACVSAVAGEYSCPLQAVPWQTAILDVRADGKTSIRGSPVAIGDLARVSTGHDW